MMLNIRPVWAALARHKLTAFLLALEVALTCAIVCTMLFQVATDVQRLHTPTGLDEAQLVLLDSARPSAPIHAMAALHKRDLANLRAIPGVLSAAAVDALPLSGDNWTSSVHRYPDGDPRHGKPHYVSLYNGTPGELATLGLKLMAGRDFRRDEYIPMQVPQGYSGINHVSAVIVTQAFAKELFPDGHALGQNVYFSSTPSRIVGIVKRLMRPVLKFDGQDQNAVLLPMVPDGRQVTYVLRVAPGRADSVLKQAKAALQKNARDRVVTDAMTLPTLRTHYFRGMEHGVRVLVISSLCLLLVTAFGIFGLASFWVRQRRRHIGIRRALGATRGDILRYFQFENFLIVSMGVAAGAVLALMLNLAMLQMFPTPRMPLGYLAGSAVLLWLIGQLAVLGPALRASRVPPVVATRSV